MSEHDEQVAVVDWFRRQYPRTRIIANVNGMLLTDKKVVRRGKEIPLKYLMMNKYRKEGLTDGVSDLQICHSDGQHHGLWLEMKDVGKTYASVSALQREWIADMLAAGYHATWAAGFDIARAICTDYMSGYYRKF